VKTLRRCSLGFSLVEVVVALGLFSFCIVAIAGLLTVGLGSTRSVVNESNAVNIASSIFGAWEAQRSGDTDLTLPGVFTNLPRLSSSGESEFHFDENGVQIPDPSFASVELDYIVTARGTPPAIDSSLQLVFSWPVTTVTNAQQTRTFERVFVK